jgi:glycosyltransferase involved in cell wall biosynthesis
MVDKKVRFFSFEKYHGKQNIGSSRIRVHNLTRYWENAQLYCYGEKPDVMIYQKVYATFDYKVPLTFPGIKILDVCDPDFKDTADIFLKETMDAMDAVVVPTEQFAKFLQPMTETRVTVIKDRFDMSEFPEKKVHRGKAKSVVWFGYSHNADGLKAAVPSLEKRGLKLIVVADQDPFAYRWATNAAEYEKTYKFVKYVHPDAYKAIQSADICVLPANSRPFEKFKSENKTVIAQLLGVPVAKNAEEVDKLLSANARNKAIDTVYGKLKAEYDCRVSVKEYKELIDEISK